MHYRKIHALDQGRGEYHCTIDLLFDWFGIRSMTTDNFCFYLQNRLIQTSRTGGQQYSDTSPFSIPRLDHLTSADCKMVNVLSKQQILFLLAL
jgi:hypothetical protein